MASLLDRPGDQPPSEAAPATLLADLRLDEIAERLRWASGGPGWAAVIATPLADAGAVAYRQEVFRDIDVEATALALRAFVGGIAQTQVRIDRASRTRSPRERDRWILTAMQQYVGAVETLLAGLDASQLRARALMACRDDLRRYTTSAAFNALRGDTRAALERLAGVTYRLRIGEQRVTVGPVVDEPDYLAEVREAFARFRPSGTAPVEPDRFDTVDMNPLEAQVLERVARQAPAPFEGLAAAVQRHQRFLDPALVRLAGEAAFYLSWLDVLAPLTAARLHWCLPAVEVAGDAVRIEAGYDLALAAQLVAQGDAVTTNVIDLAQGDRVVVITGSNRSGKTAIARAIGQIHLLAAAGCPVPAASATVPLVDAVYTHTDRAEGLADPGGRLELDLRQVAAILDRLTARGLVVFNEAFASTTVDDAIELNHVVLGEITARGARAVTVTFLHELATGPGTASLVTGGDEGGTDASAFVVARRAPEGSVHAQSVAARHGLSYADVRAELSR